MYGGELNMKLKQTFKPWTFYAYKFMSECLPIYAFYALLFLERGVELSRIPVLIALWSGFAILFEVPTGILADRVNRKNLLILGALLKGGCFIIWYFSDSFWQFALGFMIWAFSTALASGTEEGLLFDSLKRDGREEEFTGIYGKVQAAGIVGALVGIVSAGGLSLFLSLGQIALLSGFIAVIDAILALNIRGTQTKRTTGAEKKESMGETLRSALGFIKTNRVAQLLIFFIVFVASLGNYLDEFDALIIGDFGLDLFWVTVIFSIRFIFMALGDLAAPFFEKRIKSLGAMVLLAIPGCLLLVVFALFWNPLALAAFGLCFFVLSVVNVLVVSRLNHEMKEEARATVMSLLGVGQNLGMILLALAFGWLTGMVGMQQTYLMISLFGTGAAIVFWLASRINLKSK